MADSEVRLAGFRTTVFPAAIAGATFQLAMISGKFHASWPRPLRPGVLVLAVLSIALASFPVWLVWPLNEDVVLNLRFPAWPQGAVLFALGVHAAHAGWLASLSRRVQLMTGWVVLAATVALVALLAVAVAPEQELAMGADVATLLFAVLDGIIAVAFALWVLAGIQHRWPTHGPLVERAARGSFATYFIHPLVLTAIMVLFAGIPLTSELKFVLVSAAAVPACFAVGYGLTRLPGISEVL
jgi:glucans biosynthesis protein C